jgi:hypothetical protein
MATRLNRIEGEQLARIFHGVVGVGRLDVAVELRG